MLSGCTCSDNTYFHCDHLTSAQFQTSCKGNKPVWDRLGFRADRLMVENSQSSPIQHAAFLPAASPHSGDWLSLLSIASLIACYFTILLLMMTIRNKCHSLHVQFLVFSPNRSGSLIRWRKNNNNSSSSSVVVVVVVVIVIKMQVRGVAKTMTV